MSIFRRDNDLRYNDIANMPDLWQDNAEPVNSRLRSRIFAGTPCGFTEEMRETLKKLLSRERVKNLVLTVVGAGLFIRITTLIFRYDWSAKMLLPVLFLLVAAILTVIGICGEYAGIKALRAADAGEVQCFTYPYYGITRYELDGEDPSIYYFANLGDFFVEVDTDNVPFMREAVGVVITIRDTEHFYLLI